jgi:hypothetical protein
MSGLSNQCINTDANSTRNPSRWLHVKDCKNVFDNLMGTKHNDFCDAGQYVTQVSSEVRNLLLPHSNFHLILCFMSSNTLKLLALASSGISPGYTDKCYSVITHNQCKSRSWFRKRPFWLLFQPFSICHETSCTTWSWALLILNHWF